MPTYEYHCPTCETTQEHFLSISQSLDVLPCKNKLDCDGNMVKQISISSKPFVFDLDLIQARNHSGKK